MRCSNCGLPITAPEPHRCVKCNAPICRPEVRDCWKAHWESRHLARKVKDIKGPGLDRLSNTEKRNYEDGAWAVES